MLPRERVSSIDLHPSGNQGKYSVVPATPPGLWSAESGRIESVDENPEATDQNCHEHWSQCKTSRLYRCSIQTWSLLPEQDRRSEHAPNGETRAAETAGRQGKRLVSPQMSVRSRIDASPVGHDLPQLGGDPHVGRVSDLSVVDRFSAIDLCQALCINLRQHFSRPMMP